MYKYLVALLFLVAFSSSAFAVDTQKPNLDLASFKDINGKTINLTSGQDKVFLYFWAEWCPRCESKMTDFFPNNKSRTKMPVLAINTDSKLSKAQKYIEKHKITSVVVVDSDNIIRKFTSVFAVPGWALLSKQKDGKYKLIDSKSDLDEVEVSKILFN